MGGNTNGENKVDLAEYLFTRLHQLGIRTVHGVPGDYNLIALDYLKPGGLHWAGNASEMNGGYAADGYARIKGISALITVFGVGELSAVNSIGGAYAEKAPVVHIVGTPPTSAQRKGLNLHHSLGDGDFRRSAGVYRNFTCAQVNLDDPATAPELIDSTLRQCLQESRPVYIELPTDMVKAKVSSVNLTHSSITPSFRPSNADDGIEALAVSTLLSRINNAKRPAIIVDGFTPRYNLFPEADELIRATNWPTYVTPFGKGSVNESLHNFHGVYTGPAAGTRTAARSQVLSDAHARRVRYSDLVIRSMRIQIPSGLGVSRPSRIQSLSIGPLSALMGGLCMLIRSPSCVRCLRDYMTLMYTDSQLGWDIHVSRGPESFLAPCLRLFGMRKSIRRPSGLGFRSSCVQTMLSLRRQARLHWV